METSVEQNATRKRAVENIKAAKHAGTPSHKMSENHVTASSQQFVNLTSEALKGKKRCGQGWSDEEVSANTVTRLLSQNLPIGANLVRWTVRFALSAIW
jgi:hypothetical protein